MIELLVMALSLAAGQAAVEGQASIEPTKEPTAKTLCRREVPTGSIMLGRRTCLTAAQWRQVDNIRESRAHGFFHRSTRAVPNGADEGS